MSTDDPQPDWVRLEERAKAAFDQGNLLHARDLLVEASGAVGADSIVFSNLGLVSLGLEDYQGAIDAYSTLAEPDLQSRVNRGLAYERVGDVESARADYRAALLLDPDDVAALVNLGTLELEFGSDDAGRAVLEHAYALDPTTGWQLSDALRAAGTSMLPRMCSVLRQKPVNRVRTSTLPMSNTREETSTRAKRHSRPRSQQASRSRPMMTSGRVRSRGPQLDGLP